MKTMVCASMSVVLLSLSLVVSADAAPPLNRNNNTVQQVPSGRQPQITAPVQQTTPAPEKKPAPAKEALTAPSGDQLPQLPGTLTIGPAALHGVKMPTSKGLTPEFQAAWKKISEEYVFLSNNLPAFEQFLQNYYAKSQECRNRSYTKKEMLNSGCVHTDSLESCSKKLYSKCVGLDDNAELTLKVIGNMSMLKENAGTANAELTKSVTQ